jgi:hypothetical protein
MKRGTELILNKRAKIKMTPIFDFDKIKAYEVKLFYYIKFKFINLHYWKEVNKKEMSSFKVKLYYYIKFKFINLHYWKEVNKKEISSLTILADEEILNKTIDSLLKRNIDKDTILNKKIKSKLVTNLRNKLLVK